MADGGKVRSYRIRTNVGDADNVINVKLEQSYDMFEILSLKLTQENAYKLYSSDYGVIVGRVLANGGFGVPNAKISVFIPVEDGEKLSRFVTTYPYKTVQNTNADGVRYNLLPDYVDDACHQNVGTFPNKRYMLDNQELIEVFDKYYKYTTTTNEAGDYMLFGVPSGQQTLHMDVDLSDIGVLSQRPRDLVYKGYNINQFESPNKFKTDTNLNSLSQIKSQDRGVYVYPFWGDTTEDGDEIGVTRCDIQLDYKFEPTCVFMGSIVTDTGSNAIGKNCAGTRNVGKMSDLVSGEGSIEMIRKTIDGKVEEFPIKGNRVIDGDGVWCYQIPMNLDYVMTDEYGNIVPTDNPDKGIPTRTRVRFRISLDDSPNDATARKRCRYLVPNNPRLDKEDFPEFTDTLEPDYEFGTNTREESYVDLFWNNVYTVKNYIPRMQKNNSVTDGKFTGIKGVNYFGDNNPFPYNNLSIKLGFTYRLICVIVTIFIYLVWFLNFMLTIIDIIPCSLYKLFKTIGDGMCKKFLGIRPFCFLGKPFYAIANVFKSAIIRCIGISSEFCEDAVNRFTYYVGCESTPGSCAWDETQKHHAEDQRDLDPEDQTAATRNKDTLLNCVQNSLAQDNECTKLNFHNDWVNGVLYAPLWYRHIRPKKSFLFGLFKRRAKDEWCSAERTFGSLRQFQPCAVNFGTEGGTYENFDGKSVKGMKLGNEDCKNECHKDARHSIYSENGYLITKENMYGQIVYYYKAVEYDSSLPQTDANWRPDLTDTRAKDHGEVKLYFATDIVLLGSLNDCDLQGIPQFFKFLESSTYNKPEDMLFADTDVTIELDPTGAAVRTSLTQDTEMTGMDWGNLNGSDQCDDPDGGLFYSIGCAEILVRQKSCINLSRICELGVALDEAKAIDDLNKLKNGYTGDDASKLLIPDGYVSYDELYGFDARSMFATLKGNRLHTKLSEENGLKVYDFRYLYPENFDGSLYEDMKNQHSSCGMTYRYNYALEKFSPDYYKFRMGNRPYYYIQNGPNTRIMPRYENSYYFYFGLKVGKTAIDKFNSQFFSPCENANEEESPIKLVVEPNSWCTENEVINCVSAATTDETKETCYEALDGYVVIDLTGIATPYDILINGDTDKTFTMSLNGLEDDVILLATAGIIPRTPYDGLAPTEHMLLNGMYTITVTDADGNISSAELNINGKLLSYSVDKVDFKQPNNVLVPKRYSDINGVANRTDLGCPAFDKWEFGGYIVISHIWDNQNNIPLGKGELGIVCNDVSVRSVWNGFNANIANGLISQNPNKGVCVDGENIYIGVPIGDVSYTITVREICPDGNPNGNVVIRVVNVAEPIPLKLFINDVDYDVIKWFKSGLEENLDTLHPTVVGWLNIENTLLGLDANIPKTSEQWEEMWKTVDGYDDLTTDSERIAFKKAMATRVKEAFWLTCPDEPKTLMILGRSSNFPLTYYLKHKLEEEDDDKPIHYLTTGDYTDILVNETQVTDISIPSITYTENEDYGSEDTVASSTTICYAKALVGSAESSTKKRKGVYMVGMKDGTDATKPDEIEAVLVDSGSYKIPSTFKPLFHVVFIDKIMRDDLMAWAYVQNVPYYYPAGSNGQLHPGEYITLNGILAGRIFNGIPDDSIAGGRNYQGGIKYDEHDKLTEECYWVNGSDTYVWSRYSESSDGSNLSNYPTSWDGGYIGIAVKTGEGYKNKSTEPSDYSWSKFGEGDTGVDMGDGTYAWVKYRGNYAHTQEDVVETEFTHNPTNSDINGCYVSVPFEVVSGGTEPFETGDGNYYHYFGNKPTTPSYVSHKREGSVVEEIEWDTETGLPTKWAVRGNGNYTKTITEKSLAQEISVKYGQSIQIESENESDYTVWFLLPDSDASGATFTHFKRETFDIDEKLVRIKTYDSSGEEDVPTRRYLCGYQRDYDMFFPAKWYKIDKNETPERQYVPVPNHVARLRIDGNNDCGIEYEVPGDFRHNLSEVSVNDCRTNATSNLTFTIQSDNADETDNTISYLFTAKDGYGYPLSGVEHETIDGRDRNYFLRVLNTQTCSDNNLMGNADGGDDSGIASEYKSKLFNYQTTLQSLADLHATHLNNNHSNLWGITSVFVDGDGNPKPATHAWGRSDAVAFTIPYNNDLHGPVYLVTINEENIRAISPVFDFTKVEAGVKVGKVIVKSEIKTDSGNGGGSNTPSEGGDGTDTPMAAPMLLGNMLFGEGEEGGESGNEGEGGDTPTPHETETTESYKVAVFISNIRNKDSFIEHLYYFNNYNYKLHAICRPTVVDKIEDTETIMSGTVNSESTIGNALYLTIDENQYKTLSEIVSGPVILKKTIYGKFDMIEATDVTGLRHICGPSSDIDNNVGVTTWYGVTWYPNEGTWKHGDYNGSQASIGGVYEKDAKINIYQIIKTRDKGVDGDGNPILPIYTYPELIDEGGEDCRFLGFDEKYDATEPLKWPVHTKNDEETGEIVNDPNYDYEGDGAYDYTVNDSIVIYAIYKPNTLTCVWVDNVTGSEITRKEGLVKGTDVILETDDPTPPDHSDEGYTFDHWDRGGYTIGDPVTTNLVFKAIYKVKYTVYWMDGWNDISTAEIKKDEDKYAGDVVAAPTTSSGVYTPATVETAHGWRIKDADGDITHAYVVDGWKAYKEYKKYTVGTDGTISNPAEEISGVAIVGENGNITITDDMPKDIYMIAVPAEYIFEYGGEE